MIEYVLLSILISGGFAYCFIIYSCFKNKKHSTNEQNENSDMCEVLLVN